MNVDPSSAQFCEVKPWDSLTEAEKASGDWIQLPDVTRARRRSELEKAFGRTPKADVMQSLDRAFRGQ